MSITRRISLVLVTVAAMAAAAGPSTAQVEDQISVYTGDNVIGYLSPLADAFGASLNNGFFYSARIPTAGIRVSLEFPIMGVMFGDDDRTFKARTEEGFLPEQTATVPTIVGSGTYASVDGQGGTQFLFPGGLDMNSFALPMVQLRVGAVAGTEALIRFFSMTASDGNDSELGTIKLWGMGARHSISQYTQFPFDLAAGFMYQSFNVGESTSGDDLLSTSAFSMGLQASKALGAAFMKFEPYTGLSYDTFKMDVSYEANNSQLDVSFDRTNTVRWTVGLGFNFVAGHVFGQYDVASQSSFSFGIALGNLGIN